jgi:hypothetical protein
MKENPSEMHTDDIIPGVTFIGYIPPNSNKEHLGIVIINDELNVHYCYCTSKEKLSKYITKYVTIEKEEMQRYFPNTSKDTYVYLTPSHIFSMLYITFTNRIKTGEFTIKECVSKKIFNKLITGILSIKIFSEDIEQKLKELL